MNGSIFKNLEKSGDFAQNLAKSGPIGIWMGHFFFKNWYLYGSTFKFRGGIDLSLPNHTWVPPSPNTSTIF